MHNLFTITKNLHRDILSKKPSETIRTTKRPFYTSLKKLMILLISWMYSRNYITTVRSGSTNAATSKMELFVIIVNGWKL